MPNKRRNVIEDGTLTTWFLDLRSARQLGLETTGHASRGAGSPPSPSATNLYMEKGSVSRADVIDPKSISGKVIRFGATVRLADEDTDEKSTYQIVGTHESDIAKGKLSITSPLARASRPRWNGVWRPAEVSLWHARQALRFAFFLLANKMSFFHVL